jgi:hypothetical protein
LCLNTYSRNACSRHAERLVEDVRLAQSSSLTHSHPLSLSVSQVKRIHDAFHIPFKRAARPTPGGGPVVTVLHPAGSSTPNPADGAAGSMLALPPPHSTQGSGDAGAPMELM